MKVIVIETTVVSYEIDVRADNALEAARSARATFSAALDPVQFRHSVISNCIECVASDE